MEKVKEEVTQVNEDMESLFRVLDGDFELFQKVCKEFAGQQVYFPKSIPVRITHEQIRREYTDIMSHPQVKRWTVIKSLALKYSYSPERITQLVK